MIDGAKCETCVFWAAPRPKAARSYGFPSDDAPRQEMGQCRRSAPQLMRTDQGLRSLWPMTLPFGWCGEHAVVTGSE